MNEWEWQLLEDKTPLDSLETAGIQVKAGDRVRLHPRQGGDVLDIALAGQTATIEALEQDYEGKFHVCVVLDNDPGRDLGLLRQPGHRFFFDPEEVEPLPNQRAAREQSAQKPSMLIAGIGNIFLGDDGFGVEVVRRLAQRRLPADVRVADFGIRGFDLAYALQDGYETTILVDAFPHGQEPGTVSLIELEPKDFRAEEPQPSVETHGMNPLKVLRMAASMGAPLKGILLVGCEPATLGPEEGQMGLSEAVEKAVDEAVSMLDSVLNKILREIGQLQRRKNNRRKETTVATEMMHTHNGHTSDRDTLFMLSGIALMVFGAGLILSNPGAQRLLSKVGVGNLGEGVLPDIERYLRLRSM